MKKDFPNITIAGVNRKVFSIDLSGGIQEPYSLKLSFVSAGESYDLNTKDLIQVRIGSFFDFSGYAVAFSKRKSVSSGETSELTLVDTSIILDKYWVGLKGKYGGGQPALRKGTGPQRRVEPTANYNVLNPTNKDTSDPNLNRLVLYETDGDFSDINEYLKSFVADLAPSIAAKASRVTRLQYHPEDLERKIQDVTIDTLNESLDNALTELYYVYKG